MSDLEYSVITSDVIKSFDCIRVYSPGAVANNPLASFFFQKYKFLSSLVKIGIGAVILRNVLTTDNAH